jgi:hypothetical protein
MLRLLRRTPAGCLMDVALLMCFNACGDATAQQDRIVTTFCGPNGLITSEDHLTAEGLPWEMTSGSLFRSNGTGWSGRPDPGDALGETGSAAFRTVSVDRDFLDVEMSVVLRVDDLAATPRIPAQNFDGAHTWVRYQSDKQFCAVSVDRRDGNIAIKKEMHGRRRQRRNISRSEPLDGWRPDPVRAMAARRRGGARSAGRIRRDHRPPVRDTNRSRRHRCRLSSPRGNGGVGIRGDNAELRFAIIVVNPAQ